MPRQMPTMRDVALHAGVSIQTVSCVINETGTISDETRHRVFQSIELLKYKRNPIARSMRTRQTRMIALLVMDITNPVLSVIASTVEAAAYARGYNVLLYNTGLNAEREQAYLGSMSDSRADGVIIVNAIDPASALHLWNNYIPTVLIDCTAPGDVPLVSIDNVEGGYLATRHLIERGHQRIAHIAGSPTLEIVRQREAGYLRAIEEFGLAYRKTVPSHSLQWGYQIGYNATKSLLHDTPRPTALFAASDELAIGAYRALAEAGLCIPGDMSVVGFDNIEAAAFTTPPLTTIHQPFQELGERAFSLLLNLLDGGEPDEPTGLLPPRLLIRESTAEAGA